MRDLISLIEIAGLPGPELIAETIRATLQECLQAGARKKQNDE